MYEPRWDQPNPADLQQVEEPPLPDTEMLLAEVGSSYPVVSYPAAQESEPSADAVEETIFAGLVFP